VDDDVDNSFDDDGGADVDPVEAAIDDAEHRKQGDVIFLLESPCASQPQSPAGPSLFCNI
jgi:hypothetical protein